MKFTNAYIDRVKNFPQIYTDLEEIYAHRGKWWEIIEKNKKVHLEIGTGMGNFFSHVNELYPEVFHIWMELTYKRLHRTAQKTTQKWQENFLLFRDYAQNLDKIFPENFFQRVYIFFPDPWPKKRHIKNRLIQYDFLKKLSLSMKPNADFFLKTDDKNYFEWCENIFSGQSDFTILEKNTHYKSIHDFDKGIETEFERIWKQKEKTTYFFHLKKIAF